ncbi:unnamed protein product [Clonostachys chloroleuca]|uniref:Mannosyl phosphorylinositol ceramide synthase SUR1 n=1 Tax=Clonostachys chloroleuca TaxID=1926264 RepID=A0AA35M838_9HYPO|nr:unnamed protein product [Clonostachys chloroleuca]
MATKYSYEEVSLEEQQPQPSIKQRRLFLLRCLSPKRLFKFSFTLVVVDLSIIAFLVWLVGPLIILLTRNDELFGPRAMPGGSVLGSEDSDSGEYEIPRILHQTTPNDTIPQKWIDSQRSCQEVYSNFTYMLWTDESAHEFLATEYPWFVDLWDNYAFPIQRADAIRYFVLYHFGGIYLDMDTVCVKQFPIFEVISETEHRALFQSTKPTGVTNDVMISTAKHPALYQAISELPFYYRWTRFWARLQPYSNIMFSSGPMFISLVISDYLRHLPSRPSPTFNVVTPHQMLPYITDLESSTWHTGDARVLMWLGDRPWTWYGLAVIGCLIGFGLVNHGLSWMYGYMCRRSRMAAYPVKQSNKLT